MGRRAGRCEQRTFRLQPCTNTLDRVTDTTAEAPANSQPDRYRLEQGRPPPTLRGRVDPRSGRGDVHRHGVDRRGRRRAGRTHHPQRHRLDDRELCGRRSAGDVDAGAGDGTADRRAGAIRGRRPDNHRHRVRRHPQRQAARLLPQQVRRRRRRRARHRHHADAVNRLPAIVPLLGRTGLQGRVRHHAGHRPGLDGGVEQSARSPAPSAPTARWRCASATRWR